MKVRATRLGYYGDNRRWPGDVFTLAQSDDFSGRWMECVPDDTPERCTTAKQALADTIENLSPLPKTPRPEPVEDDDETGGVLVDFDPFAT